MGKIFSTIVYSHSTPIAGTLHVIITNDIAVSVIATKDTKSISLIYDNINGYWKGNVSSSGLWTITASNGTESGSTTVNVSSIGVYNVSLALEIYYLSATVAGATPTSVTATKDQINVNLVYNSSSGTWGAKLPSTGTWTVTATNGTQSPSSTVSVTSVGTYNVTITFIIGTLQITVSNGTASSVTATQGSTVVSLTYVSSKWTATVGSGAWTIKATKSGGYTKSGTITVSATQTYTLTLTFNSLPDGYTQYSYIQGSRNGAYINTNLYLISSNIVSTKVYVAEAARSTQLEVWTASDNTMRQYLILDAGNDDIVYASSTGQVENRISYTVDKGNTFTLAASASYFNINSTNYSYDPRGSRYRYSSVTSNNRVTCKINLVNSGANTIAFRIYYFYIQNSSGTYLRKLVPVTNSSGACGMFDTANNVFYGLSTGAAVVG